tara:strand:- start:2088 stop:3071 length:984 start_codon:yes stop_codon:yes gene_type:complete
MAQDLMRMLTEITPTQQPVAGTAGFRGMFGQQQAQGVASGLGKIARGGAPSAQARMGQALAGLDLTKPQDLAKLAKIQQGTGDFVGAARTAAKIEAMKQTAVAEDRTARRMKITEETFQMNKAAKIAAIKQATVTEDRTARRMEITEETFQMNKVAKERDLDRADAVLAQQGVSRALFAAQARDNSNEPLAKAIETGGVSLERAGSILFGSSNALVKPATPEETEAFDRILDTKTFKTKIEKLKTGWVFKTLTEDTKQAIYFKAKELMARGRLTTEEALTQAISAVEALDLPTGDGDGSTDASRKDRRDKTGGNVPESKTDDAFGEL